MRRRGTPELLVATLILVLIGWYVWYTHSVYVRLQADAKRSTDMYARVFHALADTTQGATTAALLDLSRNIRDQGVPLIWTDTRDSIGDHANLPFERNGRVPDDDPRIREYIRVLAKEHPPIVDTLFGKIYFGDTPIVRGLRIIPVLQALMAGVLLFSGLYIIRAKHDAARERLWAGMARESAHQLGTPLSSLAGWIELLEERANDEGSHAAVTHMRGDLDRLDRVAHRFERIGREAKLEPLDVARIVENVGRYFKARVPTLANTVSVDWDVAPDLPQVFGDSVLLEWAVEVLAKNAVDALAGRGGHIRLSATRRPEAGILIAVSDDGPGVPAELRSRVFDPGFSTKKSGWGIGLSLAKRIVEENHEGKLVLANTEQGATFEIILR
jgi:signal transduction histidine kinase